MRASAVLLAAGFLAASAIGKPPQHEPRAGYAVKDKHFVPRRWHAVKRAPADHKIELRIALKQNSFADLERRLYEVSDPDHAQYGHHLSEHEVSKLVEPADETMDLVLEWLAENNVDDGALQYSKSRDWITVSLPVHRVESLLDTEYSVYRHDDGDELVRTPAWSLPKHLHEHIDTIQPTNSWFRSKPKSKSLKVVQKGGALPDLPNYSNASVAAVCDAEAVSPACLRTWYDTIHYKTKSVATNLMGLTDYLNETNNRSDTYQFLSKYRPEAKKAAYDFKFDVINNGSTLQELTEAVIENETDVEGNLDVQTMLGIAWPTPLTAYTVGGLAPFTPDEVEPTDSNEPYVAWLATLLATPDAELAKVISTSYDDDEQTVPRAYATRVCNDMAQLGARGVSLFFASGDDGVGPSGYCRANDGTNATTFLPEFPSTCPYVTSVGGTMKFGPAQTVAHRDSNDYTGGGGFSSYFARPAYQDGVVPAYVAGLGGKDAAAYDAGGRAYPDLAGQGYGYISVWAGGLITVDGTSAATPSVAAVFALVNDALLAAGKPALGFLNPWLYKRGEAMQRHGVGFRDVTKGTAEGCAEIGDGTGFPATEGWDAVTGWGTPVLGGILKTLGVEY